jgi:hypothetical protein
VDPRRRRPRPGAEHQARLRVERVDRALRPTERPAGHAAPGRRPSYRLEPLAAELFGGERVWTYSFEFNDTDAKLLALEYHELGECVLHGKTPEVTGEEGRADLALNYAPFEAGRLGRPVTLDDLVSGRADAYQREVDEQLGLLRPVGV